MIVNAFRSVQAWRTLALVLISVLIFETCALVWLANTRSVILIPQGLANSRSQVELNLGEPYSPDYLSNVAKGDAYSLLNWTPTNIDSQYGAFIARLTPELQAAQRTTLLADVKRHSEDELTQSFYVTRTYVKDASVTLHGVLVRSSAGKEVYRGNAVYTFEYVNAGNGLLLVKAVSQPSPRS